MAKIYTFGSSWAAGIELKKEHADLTFTHWIGKHYDLEYKNYSIAGACLGLILNTLVSNHHKITSEDKVIAMVPPDGRILNEGYEEGFYTVSTYQLKLYEQLLADKTLEWFRYHHAIQIYTIQKILDDIGCEYLMAHTYGNLKEYKKYSLPINYDKFLSADWSLTQLLNGKTKDFDNYPSHLEQGIMYGVEDADGPNEKQSAEIFTGIYFEGCENHPNLLGHKKIAEMMIQKLG